MATREENLKKINDELEKMSDDELEQVAGGFLCETSDDSKFLNTLLQGHPAQPDRYGRFKSFFKDTKITAAWLAVGIDFSSSSTGFNDYKLKGRPISQTKAREHAMEVMNKHLERSDWDW